ncbi:MAG: hypothetical protein ACJAXA_003732 [Candidatus Aldehydirespiratoraceae bacterium]|jgi:hypothetical protein
MTPILDGRLMMHRRTSIRLISFATATALLVASCGSGSAGDADISMPTLTVAAAEDDEPELRTRSVTGACRPSLLLLHSWEKST